jgi:hypothetical protein
MYIILYFGVLRRTEAYDDVSTWHPVK